MTKKTSEYRADGRPSYAPPRVTVYGSVKKLTASGTIPGNENGGHPTQFG